MEKMFCVIGQICSGKNSLCRMITDMYPGIEQLIYYTSRSKREGEEDGKDYFFCDAEELNCHNDDVIESRMYMAYLSDNLEEKIPVYYGTKLDRQFQNRYLVVPCAMDQLGYYIDYFGPEKISVIYLNPPREVLIARSLKRKDDIKEFSDRLARDNHWFTEENIGKLKKKFPYNSWLELNASEILDERDLVNKFILKNL